MSPDSVASDLRIFVQQLARDEDFGTFLEKPKKICANLYSFRWESAFEDFCVRYVSLPYNVEGGIASNQGNEILKPGERITDKFYKKNNPMAEKTDIEKKLQKIKLVL